MTAVEIIEEINRLPRDERSRVIEFARHAGNQPDKSFEVTPELEAWLLESADKPTTPLTARDFDGIRERVRARTTAKP